MFHSCTRKIEIHDQECSDRVPHYLDYVIAYENSQIGESICVVIEPNEETGHEDVYVSGYKYPVASLIAQENDATLIDLFNSFVSFHVPTVNVVLTEKNGMYHAKYENSTSVIAYSKSLAYVNKKIQKLAEIYNVNVV